MLEANPVEVTPDVERRVNEGFKAWMGTSFLSSDEEDDTDNYLEEVDHLARTNSTRQRAWVLFICFTDFWWRVKIDWGIGRLTMMMDTNEFMDANDKVWMLVLTWQMGEEADANDL